MLISNKIRALILNLSDAISAHNESLSNEIRTSVSGKMVGESWECDRDVTKSLIKRTFGMSSFTDEIARRAVDGIVAADVASMTATERAQRACRLHGDAWAMIR